jgi:hypothetical protein
VLNEDKRGGSGVLAARWHASAVRLLHLLLAGMLACSMLYTTSNVHALGQMLAQARLSCTLTEGGLQWYDIRQ